MLNEDSFVSANCVSSEVAGEESAAEPAVTVVLVAKSVVVSSFSVDAVCTDVGGTGEGL